MDKSHTRTYLPNLKDGLPTSKRRQKRRRTRDTPRIGDTNAARVVSEIALHRAVKGGRMKTIHGSVMGLRA